jgi:hypothetical protein
MKTIKILIAAIIVSVSTMSFAATTEPVATTNTISKERIMEIVKSEISFPQSEVNFITNGMVAVSFTFDSNDQLVITNLNYSNPNLKAYVSSQLSKISIFNARLYSGSEFSLKFLFNLK